MTITNERTESLAKYLYENREKAEALMEMRAEDACAKINAEGYDFAAEELIELANDIANLTELSSDELSEESLDSVAGGGAKLKVLWWLVKNMPKALYIAWTAEPGKIRKK